MDAGQGDVRLAADQMYRLDRIELFRLPARLDGQKRWSGAGMADDMDDPMSRLEQLYVEHGPALLRYLRRSFGGALAPEELLQETFLQAVRQADRLAQTASPRAWLFTVARRIGITALRRRRSTVVLTESVEAPAPTDEDARLEAMRRAIAALPVAQRKTLELRLHDELSYAEIAEVLNIPVGTVRSRVHHAVGKVRKMLLAEDDASGKTKEPF